MEARVGTDVRCVKPKDAFRDRAECSEMVVLPSDWRAARHSHTGAASIAVLEVILVNI